MSNKTHCQSNNIYNLTKETLRDRIFTKLNNKILFCILTVAKEKKIWIYEIHFTYNSHKTEYSCVISRVKTPLHTKSAHQTVSQSITITGVLRNRLFNKQLSFELCMRCDVCYNDLLNEFKCLTPHSIGRQQHVRTEVHANTVVRNVVKFVRIAKYCISLCIRLDACATAKHKHFITVFVYRKTASLLWSCTITCYSLCESKCDFEWKQCAGFFHTWIFVNRCAWFRNCAEFVAFTSN